MTCPDQTPRRSHTVIDRVARVLTEILAPSVVIMVLPLGLAWVVTKALLPTLGWGLFIALTSSILPMVVIIWGARTGRWDGHHVRNRRGRLVPLLAVIGFSAIGLVLLIVFRAPWPLIALDITFLATLFVTSAITLKWKVSIHAAVAMSAVAIMAIASGPEWWFATLLVGAVGWSRVHLQDHTTAQVIVGALTGMLAAGLFALLTQ
ncbi:hypothetical protein Ae706Ps2_6463c [Pseudonocardia sp. Ae706_Ps2]|nr:hypothetical protein [Pseudonocardia sp. Ae706_Ps2]OLM09441.1 hypothetical protein Ae706Ps2_6463c [Pseudonocardia sp. Ae706_Ps2]